MSSQYLYGANVHANGIRQHYLRYGGKGLPVIIVPGITSPAITWGFVAERLGLHFDTYVLDIRGRGLSEASETLDYSLDAQAADLEAFASALQLENYVVIGHSMGARIAIRMAATYQPKSLSKVVLVDPPVSGPHRREYPADISWYVDSIISSQKGMTAEDMLNYCPTWSQEQRQLRAEWLHTCDLRAIELSFSSFHEDDIHIDLPKLEIPVLLLLAERGGVVLDTDVEEIKDLISTVQVARVSDAGHMIPWDNEEGFYQGFGDFLGQEV